MVCVAWIALDCVLCSVDMSSSAILLVKELIEVVEGRIEVAAMVAVENESSSEMARVQLSQYGSL